jgi:Ca2+-binding RTX toxin-like protein
LAGEGIDTVISDVGYILGDNVENLTLAFNDQIPITSVITGTGNGLDNVIKGNAQPNDLYGLLGNDTLEGAGGDDYLDGGAGNDLLDGGGGSDTAKLSGGRADYEILESSSGKVVLRDKRGNDGDDTFLSVEVFEFRGWPTQLWRSLCRASILRLRLLPPSASSAGQLYGHKRGEHPHC